MILFKTPFGLWCLFLVFIMNLICFCMTLSFIHCFGFSWFSLLCPPFVWITLLFICSWHIWFILLHFAFHIMLISFIGVGFSFCLYPIIMQVYSFKILKNGIYSTADKLLPWQTILLHQVCGKCYTKLMFILVTDGTIGSAVSDTWCQMAWHQIVDTGQPMYPMLWGVDTNREPPAYSRQVCGPILTIWYHTILHQVSLIAQPVVTSVVRKNAGKYKTFFRPDEAMLLVMVKACLHQKNILLSRTLSLFFFFVL